MWKRLLYVVFILFCVEVGLFLAWLPWTELWDNNVLLSLFPSLRGFLLSDYTRGALSGLGLINLWLAASDVWNYRRNVEALERRLEELEGAGAAASHANANGDK